MKNYEDVLYFESKEDHYRAKELLRQHNIEVNDTVPYDAMLRHVISEKLSDNEIECSEENIEQVVNAVENDDALFEGTDDILEDAISKIFEV